MTGMMTFELTNPWLPNDGVVSMTEVLGQQYHSVAPTFFCWLTSVELPATAAVYSSTHTLLQCGGHSARCCCLRLEINNSLSVHHMVGSNFSRFPLKPSNISDC